MSVYYKTICLKLYSAGKNQMNSYRKIESESKEENMVPRNMNFVKELQNGIRALDRVYSAKKKPMPLEVHFATEADLVREDAPYNKGHIITRETAEGGVGVKFEAGDAIVTGIEGEVWPISREKFNATYAPSSGGLELGTDGSFHKVAGAVNVRPMNMPFRVSAPWGELRGRKGDFLVEYGPEDYGVVGEEIFKKTYENKGRYSDKVPDSRELSAWAEKARRGEVAGVEPKDVDGIMRNFSIKRDNVAVTGDTDEIRALSVHYDPQIRKRIARNENATDGVIRALAGDASLEVQLNVCANEAIPQRLAQELADAAMLNPDMEGYIRLLNLVENPGLEEGLIEKIAEWRSPEEWSERDLYLKKALVNRGDSEVRGLVLDALMREVNKHRGNRGGGLSQSVENMTLELVKRYSLGAEDYIKLIEGIGDVTVRDQIVMEVLLRRSGAPEQVLDKIMAEADALQAGILEALNSSEPIRKETLEYVAGEHWNKSGKTPDRVQAYCVEKARTVLERERA